MRTKLTGVVGGIALVPILAAVPVQAHHAFSAEFDAEKPVKFNAVVTRMEWVNPHVWIFVDAKMPDGMVEQWAIEAGSPNVLFRRGLTKQVLPAGTAIVVDGYQAKDGTNRANGRDLTLPDGTKAFLGASGTGAPFEVQRPGIDTVPQP